ncbi:MAG TPA: tRNA (N6-threonylcarbamoyladenosine(37)-N6)-methyltransferase TrmO [Cellvibrio sp.]|nr:tRNA (N6-threonylcarbamoyladenosine(37)-N6)-methyltransferase TrmO [Cellvibrio sp.]
MYFQFPAIGIIHSCFKEKFGIPRQPGLAPLAQARLELSPPYDDPAAVTGLETCSHIWVQFVFHANSRASWKAKVRPPRLGGNKTLGVFATRSPVRPAAIGLSVVKLERIEQRAGKLCLLLSGVDFLDGTPVLDIKPYIPYVDKVEGAFNHFAPAAPTLIGVTFTEQQLAFCASYQTRTAVDLKGLIQQILQQDPRPQYQTPSVEKIYGMKLLDLDLRWRYQTDGNIALEEILSIVEAPQPASCS